MLTDREVLSTLNMLRNEHLDVRTVTLGISLFDCASHDFDVFAYRVRAKIAKYAPRATCRQSDEADSASRRQQAHQRQPHRGGGRFLLPRSDGAGLSGARRIRRGRGVDFLGGFGALVEKGITPGERNLIDALPEALATTDRICSSINVASTRSGINMDAVALLGQRILDVAEATHDRDGLGCAKLVVFANIPQDVPFMAGAYLGVGGPMW